jgi:hypothetical protein
LHNYVIRKTAILLSGLWQIIYLPLISENEASWLTVREHSDSFEDEGRAGHMIAGLSGGTSGAASPKEPAKQFSWRAFGVGLDGNRLPLEEVNTPIHPLQTPHSICDRLHPGVVPSCGIPIANKKSHCYSRSPHLDFQASFHKLTTSIMRTPNA